MSKRQAAAAAFASGLVLGAGTASADSFAFENAIVTPGAQQISIVRLPITTSAGKVIYRDIVIQFTFSGEKLSFVTGYPKVTVSPAIPSPSFVAGTYYPSGEPSSRIYSLQGPLPGPSGRSKWVLTNLISGAVEEFYAGAISGHPFQSRITAAKINAPYTFGYSVFGDLYLSSIGKNDLVAISPTSSTSFTVYDYTEKAKDSQAPVGIYTMLKK